MATTISNEYDHIDVVNGSNTNRHYIRDTESRTNLQAAEKALGYAGDKIENTSGSDLTYYDGSKWNFTQNTSKAQTSPSWSYLVYAIPSGTKVLCVNGYTQTADICAYGFYNNTPGTSGAKCLYSSGSKYQTGKDMAYVTGVRENIVGVPEGAAYLVVNVGSSKTTRGVWNFVSTRNDGHQAYTLANQLNTTLTGEIARSIGWMRALSSGEDWNDITAPGVYRSTVAMANAHAPFTTGTLYQVAVTKARNTDGVGGLTQIAWNVNKPDGIIMMRICKTDSDEWTGWAPINNTKLPTFSTMHYKPFDGVLLNGNPSGYRLRHIAIGNNKMYVAVNYSSLTPYRFIVKELGANLDVLNGTEQTYDIMIDGQAMADKKDGGNSVMQISHMAFCNGYLFVTVSPTMSSPADTTVINSYFVCIDAETMETVRYIPFYEERALTVRIDEEDNRALIGCRRSVGDGRFFFVSTAAANPGVVLYDTDDDSEITGIDPIHMHSCFYTDSSGKDCFAFACYSYVCGYYLGNGEIIRNFRWANISSIGTNMMVAGVEARYPYVYFTVCPNSTGKLSGSKIMGIGTLDISDPDSPQLVAFSKIPEHECGNAACRVSYSNGTFTPTIQGYTSPSIIRIKDNYLYTNNEDNGIAVFDITDNSMPVFAGIIDIDVMPIYFEMYGNMIFACGYNDFVHNELPKVVAASTVLGG